MSIGMRGHGQGLVLQAFRCLCRRHGNFIDTANNYQDQQSEMWIGEWMMERKIVISWSLPPNSPRLTATGRWGRDDGQPLGQSQEERLDIHAGFTEEAADGLDSHPVSALVGLDNVH
jgi:hypothetical protein